VPKRAFTLVELLTALAVVVLLAAIVFPVVARARRAGYRAESISHLRQVGVAIESYRQDYDGVMPFRHLDPFVEERSLPSSGLLLSHTDAFEEGYGRAVSECIDQEGPTRTETSYETLMVSEAVYRHVKAIDPDAAIVVDRTHGDVLQEADRTCRRVHFYYSGPILRLYEDTHVKIARFSLLPQNAPADVTMHWSRMRLFTNAPQPPLSSP
jgi:prepilin-type N-terminal cleavage/methylation domain-containing protein